MGLFSKIKEGLKKTKEALSYKLNKVFTGGVLTDDFTTSWSTRSSRPTWARRPPRN